MIGFGSIKPSIAANKTQAGATARADIAPLSVLPKGITYINPTYGTALSVGGTSAANPRYLLRLDFSLFQFLEAIEMSGPGGFEIAKHLLCRVHRRLCQPGSSVGGPSVPVPDSG